MIQALILLILCLLQRNGIKRDRLLQTKVYVCTEMQQVLQVLQLDVD